MTLGSLFDGSGGFPLAGAINGIMPLWASEIEPYPIAVTRARFPQMRHIGDVSKVKGSEIEPVDIITFGSPCQDMSVAGKRAGMKHAEHDAEETTRSGLFYEAVRIIREMREATNGRNPAFAVWENVPGAFSSNKGEDFRCVLEELASIKGGRVSIPRSAGGKWCNAGEIVGNGFSVAWRILDAQFWGVPQRRKRIYLVADFTGWRAGKILFESEGLSGYSAEGFRAWQRTAENPEKSTGTAGGENERLVLCDQGGNRMDVLKDKVATIRAEAHHPPIVMESAGFCTEHSAKSRSIGYEEETSPTLRAGVVPAAVALENHPADSRIKIEEGEKIQTLTSRCGTGGNNVPLLMEQKVFGVCAKNSNSMKSDNPNSGFYEAETTRTLDANGGRADCNQGGMVVVCVDQGGGKSSVNVSEELAPTLATSHGGEPVIAFAQNQREEVRDLENKAGALAAEPGIHQQTFVLQGSMIGRADKNGPHGSGVNEDVCFTLDGADRHAVAYGIGRDAFNQGKNALYKPAIEEEKQPTLVAKGPGAVAEPTYSASKASFFTMASEEVANTLVATDYKDPPIVNDDDEDGVHYIVRRLTPTECARLQGFPDCWGYPDRKDSFTDEEAEFWEDMRKAYAEANGKTYRPMKPESLLKWYNGLHTDSAEYKMWGNGIALPCAEFVIRRIKEVHDERH